MWKIVLIRSVTPLELRFKVTAKTVNSYLYRSVILHSFNKHVSKNYANTTVADLRSYP